jgi:hypothetical protein
MPHRWDRRWAAGGQQLLASVRLGRRSCECTVTRGGCGAKATRWAEATRRVRVGSSSTRARGGLACATGGYAAPMTLLCLSLIHSEATTISSYNSATGRLPSPYLAPFLSNRLRGEPAIVGRIPNLMKLLYVCFWNAER